jgi:phytoene synthase
MSAANLLDSLPRAQRLALAYAPAKIRGEWLTLLAFDTRLAGIVRRTSEPMLGQLRLAWWRDRLGGVGGLETKGEPLLVALSAWAGDEVVLLQLVDAWEAMLTTDDPQSEPFAGLSQARAAALAALAIRAGCPGDAEAARRAGFEWSIAELALGQSDPKLQQTLTKGLTWDRVTLPRALRPLAVLYGLARRAIIDCRPGVLESPADLLVALRIGLLGR